MQNHGPAIIGRLIHFEAKRAAKKVPLNFICSDDGADLVLAELDRFFGFQQSPIRSSSAQPSHINDLGESFFVSTVFLLASRDHSGDLCDANR